jgi:hypothetical protein
MESPSRTLTAWPVKWAARAITQRAEGEATAHAAAPEMLKTLKYLLRTQVVDLTMLMLVIAKAEGRQGGIGGKAKQ